MVHCSQILQDSGSQTPYSQPLVVLVANTSPNPFSGAAHIKWLAHVQEEDPCTLASKRNNEGSSQRWCSPGPLLRIQLLGTFLCQFQLPLPSLGLSLEKTDPRNLLQANLGLRVCFPWNLSWYAMLSSSHLEVFALRPPGARQEYCPWMLNQTIVFVSFLAFDLCYVAVALIVKKQ